MKTKRNDCEVLATLKRAVTPLSVKQILARTGISRSSAYNELNALVEDKKASYLRIGDESFYFLKGLAIETSSFIYQGGELTPSLKEVNYPNTITINYYIHE